jgi:small subunit ribosomal protein S4
MGIAGEYLIKILESRLDNIVFRMGYAKTRKEARQLVRHNHFTLNGKKANIPSILVKVGDVIAVKDTSKSSEKFKQLAELAETRLSPSWLEVDKANGVATVKAAAVREELDFPVEEQLVVELYSK